MIWYSIPLSWTIVWLPVIFVVHLAFTLGMALLLAMANLFYRDVKYLFEVVITVWMFATSVVYPIALVGGKLGLLMRLNPMTPIIEGYRSVILFGQPPRPFVCGRGGGGACWFWSAGGSLSTGPSSGSRRTSDAAGRHLRRRLEEVPFGRAARQPARPDPVADPARPARRSSARRSSGPSGTCRSKWRRAKRSGIIGPNGAGKSTTLKLLTRILKPTRGRCVVHGRVGALIEVAAGFHPDLTGRENIFLQGSIMGMRRHEILTKLDDIIEFAGIGSFVDTQVKRYSSGMQARLGFSVAAHLNPDVLFVDEVLSVGDMSFQARCIERLKSQIESGVTLIFVSHNLQAVASLCKRAVVFCEGRQAVRGAVRRGARRLREGVTDLEPEIRADQAALQAPRGGVHPGERPLGADPLPSRGLQAACEIRVPRGC